jgi:DNA modification methylase
MTIAAVIRADARNLPLPDASVDLIVTSPPYFGLRSYTDGGEVYAGQLGSEATPGEYVATLVDCTREWVRVLKPSGSLFVNLGDKYSGAQQQTNGPMVKAHPSSISSAEHYRRMHPRNTGVPAKSLLGLPWRYALAVTDQLGLILRSEIIWAKPNGLPESVTDRVRRAHEQVFHFTRQPRYYSAVDEIREEYSDRVMERQKYVGRPAAPRVYAPGDRNDVGRSAGIMGFGSGEVNPLGKLPGSVWSIPSAPLTVPPHLGVDHFAAFPPALVRPIVLGWSPPGVCVECGEGRRPVVAGGRNGDGAKPHKAAVRVASFDWAKWKEGEPHRITGYACACARPDAPTRPAVVLDPFGGTGTTAVVASVHGRHGISVDLSADYCRLAAWRCHDPGERARALDVPKPPPVTDGQLILWD